MAIIFGLCAFLCFLSFKPSEPYLSQYLVCELNTQEDYCDGFANPVSCGANVPCTWSMESNLCTPTTCSTVSSSDCGNSDYDYCTKHSHSSGDTCEETKCYKNFTEDEVNDEIYPWSTYAYLPFLLVLGPAAELFSYRAAILVGICGRLVTRFLLLYGKSITDMQWMQVSYAFGTAAEDVLSAYVFYTLSPAYYQVGTSYIKATSLATNMAAGIVGDLLVVEGDVSLRILMWISAVSVCIGFIVGVLVIQAPHLHAVQHNTESDHKEKGGKAFMEANNSDTMNPIGENSTDSAIDSPTSSSKHGFLYHNDSTHIDNTTTSVVNPATQLTVSEKLRLFKEQLVFLRLAFRSRTLTALVLYWVMGNAVFMTLYDYEVAIYAELNGSNEWNGSVLAIMLVAGTIGALLPTWLKHDTEAVATSNDVATTDTTNNSTIEPTPTINAEINETTAATTTTTTFTATSEFTVGTRITIAGILSCVNLLLFVLSWEVVASVAFLALFFATWQYINVVTFARLALALKVAQVESTSAACVDATVSAGIEGERLTEQERQLSVDLEPHKIICAPVSAGPHLYNMRLSRQSRQSRDSNDVGISLHNPDSLSALHPPATLNSRDATDLSSLAAHPIDRETMSSTPIDISDAPDPPYSVALVTIIALNAAVQIILQAIAFSGLALPLRTSCYVFVLVFCVSTVLYVVALLVLFGLARMRAGVSKLFTK
eukprot:CAMPEP_0185007190 /NCGR_PEP_ID=MMETSP1098-20130426/86451_1 /TAXON_ID=89044 /ORGANISM="Spumella elongata, Strain CCAP 955/1" /LENGTH=713 /DNA_ID=CAMNT_0027535495 /DNA_START=119 /DNA_END=2260 /DNA_ORIENTATION=+